MLDIFPGGTIDLLCSTPETRIRSYRTLTGIRAGECIQPLLCLCESSYGAVREDLGEHDEAISKYKSFPFDSTGGLSTQMNFELIFLTRFVCTKGFGNAVEH